MASSYQLLEEEEETANRGSFQDYETLPVTLRHLSSIYDVRNQRDNFSFALELINADLFSFILLHPDPNFFASKDVKLFGKYSNYY